MISENQDNRKRFQIPDLDYREAAKVTGRNDPIEVWRELVRGYKEHYFSKNGPVTGNGYSLRQQILDAKLALQTRHLRNQIVKEELELGNTIAKDGKSISESMRAAKEAIEGLTVEPFLIFCGDCNTMHKVGPCPKPILPE